MDKLLLHLCCGPCGSLGWTELLAEGYDVTGFFDGGNIHPQGEYHLRANAARTLAGALNSNLDLPGYDPREWYDLTKPLAQEGERGKRCQLCFSYQLRRAAQRAVALGATSLCTSLTLSRHKDPVLINAIGSSIAASFGLHWVERVWRKQNGVARAGQIAKSLGLYRQSYCGCRYSLASRRREDFERQVKQWETAS